MVCGVPLLFGLLLWRLEVMAQASARVEESGRASSQLRELERLVYEMEAGLRGYVLTRQPDYLRPYQQGRASLGAAYERLGHGLAERPDQLLRLGTLKTRIDAWLGYAGELLQATRAGVKPADLPLSRGQALVAMARDGLERMEAAEDAYRGQLAAAARLQARIGEGATVAVLAGLFVWLAVILLRLRRAERERTAAEDALRASEASLRQLFDGATEAIFVADQNRRCVDANPAACGMLGYAREEIIGKGADEVLAPEEIPRMLTLGERASRDGWREFAEWKLRHKDGRVITAEMNVGRLPDLRYLAFARDVTERAENESRRQLLLDVGVALSSGLDAGPMIERVGELLLGRFCDVCGIHFTDEQGRLRRRRLMARDPRLAVAAEEMVRAEAARGLPTLTARVLRDHAPVFFPDFGPAAQREVLREEEQLRGLAALGVSSLMVLPLVAHDRTEGALTLSLSGGRRWAEADFLFGRELASRLALAFDNARLYGRARRAIAARDEVLAVVAHDLRNPLSVVLLQAGLLDRVTREGAPGLSKAPQLIRHSVERMDRIIRDLLDATRLETGQLTVTKERLVPREVAAEALAAERPLAAAAGLELLDDFAPGIPEVLADRARLLQVFENLLGNAVKFTPPGGRVTVGAAPGGEGILFWVADTGRGIAPADLPHVFDRYSRVAGTRRGTGLGLSIVKGIVEAHGGRAWAESTPGRGSVFFFTLPAAAPAGAEIAGPPPA